MFTRCETLKQCMEMKSSDSDETKMETGCSRFLETKDLGSQCVTTYSRAMQTQCNMEMR